MQPVHEDIIRTKFQNGIKNDPIDITRLKGFCKECGIEISDFDTDQIFTQLIENNGRYYLREMLVSEDDDEKIESQVNKWIQNFDFFEIEALLYKFENAKFSKRFILYERYARDRNFLKTLEKIREIFEENGGEIEQQKLFLELEHLTKETIRWILKKSFPKIYETRDGYFKDTESLELPEGFKEKVNNAVKKLIELGFVANKHNLILALSLEYGENICEKYKLQDTKLLNRFKEKN